MSAKSPQLIHGILITNLQGKCFSSFIHVNYFCLLFVMSKKGAYCLKYSLPTILLLPMEITDHNRLQSFDQILAKPATFQEKPGNRLEW